MARVSGTSKTKGGSESRTVMNHLKKRHRWKAKNFGELRAKAELEDSMETSTFEACLRARDRTNDINLHIHGGRISVYVF